MSKISIDGIDINIVSKNEDDFICLTHMVAKHEDGSKLIEKWLTLKGTIDFLGAWETLNNPDFNSPEFRGIRSDAGSNAFFMSVKQWINRTRAIGITAKSGRYGGTYAHKDIAFEFGSYISPLFKLLLIKEFQRLKDEEAARLGSGWDIRRFVSKANYKIQTDAIKEILVPISTLPGDKTGILYAEEAEIINYAMFGTTSKEWKLNNPQLCLHGMNMRDYANTHQLIVLANLESLNSELIKAGQTKEYRLRKLREISISQLKSLANTKDIELALAESPHKQKESPQHVDSNTLTSIDKLLPGAPSVLPPKKDDK